MNKKTAVLGTFLGATAIVFGAFGAHALKIKLSVEQLSSFETAVKYQMYHALLLLIISGNAHITEKLKNTLFYFIGIGVFIFSGSIYLLSTRAISGLELSFLGPITPVGGLLLITAWVLLFVYFIKKKI